MHISLTISTSWQPNYDAFLEGLSIEKNGLGEQLFAKVFRAFFIYSVDVKSDFEKFYSVEYSNLKKYLDIKYGVELNDSDLEKDYIFLIDYLPQIVNDDYDDNVLDKVLTCIKKLELSDED